MTTAVTCPTVRIAPGDHRPGGRHLRRDARRAGSPSASGSGEALNEHILGDRWPSADVRLEMLEEAVALIRELWTGEVVTTEGKHYTRRPRPDLQRPGDAAGDLRLRLRAEGDRPRGADRRRLHQHRARRRAARAVQGAVRRQARPGRRQGRVRADPGGGLGARPPAVAERRAARRDGPGPADARALRAGHRAGHRWSRPASRSSPATTPTEHLEQIQQYADAGYDELYVANMGPHFTGHDRVLRREGAARGALSRRTR